jgi:hypothetical protein
MGNSVHLGAQDRDSDRPKSKDSIFILRDAFQNLARTNRCDATVLQGKGEIFA